VSIFLALSFGKIETPPVPSVQTKLHQASETIEQAKVRSRAVGRKFKDVQELPIGETSVLLSVDASVDNGEVSENDSV